MAAVLLANIGNRDVWVGRACPIPGEIHPQWNREASRRALGEALLKDWDACREHLDLPIIGKGVRYIRRREGKVDHVVLISSDQSGREGVAEKHLAQDTCTLAPVVERLLVERMGLAEDAVIHLTADRPADYSAMREFFRRELPLLRERFPDARFYLEVSGGTPAMTSMLLVVGVETFGMDAHPFYVSEHEEEPFLLGIGRQLVAESLLGVVRENVSRYAYLAARQTLEDNRDLLEEFVALEPLLALLDHAVCRRNFDFAGAYAAVERLEDPAWKERLLAVCADLKEPTREVLLRETVFNARLAYEVGNLWDFVVRVFQFVEGMLRYLALRLGVRFEDESGEPDEDGERLAGGWMEENRALCDALRSEGVRLETVNRYVLRRLVGKLGQEQWKEVLTLLDRLEEVGNLRNRVVHRYHPITLELLRDTYYPRKRDRKRHPPEDAVHIIQVMEEVWSGATDQPFAPEHAYTVINRMALEILEP